MFNNDLLNNQDNAGSWSKEGYRPMGVPADAGRPLVLALFIINRCKGGVGWLKNFLRKTKIHFWKYKK